MTDVTVMGAGVFGLASAYAMARRGARVRVIDPAGTGAGASGGVVGALSPHVPENWNAKKAFQLESLLMSGDWWDGVAAASGLDTGYARTGRLQPLADAAAAELARARGGAAARLWRGRAEWRVVPARSGGWAVESPSGLCVHDTLSARIAPRRAVAALSAAVWALGGEVRRDCEGRGAVLWATGAEGLAGMSRDFGRVLGAPVKGQAALLGHDAGGSPQIFAGALHVVPHADGTVAVGSTSEASFRAGTETDSALDTLIGRARSLVPALERAEVVARWAGVRARAVTRAPVLGAWPGRPGHFVANGGFKIGFGLAPLVGEVMADLILEGRDGIPGEFTVEACLGQARPLAGD
ncbi:MAG: NAD(P)/FAD-dependent oxidoreductase [Paracoccaceae bacterium]